MEDESLGEPDIVDLAPEFPGFHMGQTRRTPSTVRSARLGRGSSCGPSGPDAGARAHGALAVHDPELHIEPVLSLVIVHCGPVEEAADVDATEQRLVDHRQAVGQVPGPHGIVVGTDSVLGYLDEFALVAPGQVTSLGILAMTLGLIRSETAGDRAS